MSGAISPDAVRQILDSQGFEDISITKKDNSDEIIKSWNIASGAEHLVFSAFIKARKPGNAASAGVRNSEALNAVTRISVEACKKRLAELSKGIAHPARVEIVRMLAGQPQGAGYVCGDIVSALPLAQSSVSQHLKVLKNTGWIKGEADGPSVRYRLAEGIIDYYRDLTHRTFDL